MLAGFLLEEGGPAPGARPRPDSAQRFMDERARAHGVEVDASHAVTVWQPAAVARLIDEAARATVG